MSVGERDPHTGHMTTGHEWNGIKELNTPVPKIVYFFLIVTTIFGLIWMFLMPSWPFIHSYYKGVLGLDQKQIVAVELDKGIALRAPWVDQVIADDFANIQNNPELMKNVLAAGHRLFGDNCAACHGEDGKGNIDMGAPDLTDQFWIYGGSRQLIFETVYNGRQGHMPSWATRLTPAQIKIITLYILDLRAQQE